MYGRLAFSRVLGAIALILITGLNVVPIRAQSSSPSQPPTTEQHEHPAATPGREHEDHDMQMAREGSGTAWLPDTTPMYAIHWRRGAWQFMAHENVFVQLLHESGDRVQRIQGSTSGTLGFLLTEVGGGRPFSEALRAVDRKSVV